MSCEEKIQSLFKKCSLKNAIIREFLAEFLGTFILILLGDGAVAQVVLNHSKTGNFFLINWGYGLAVTFGIIATGGVSGAHMNPAVTVGLAAVGKFPWKKVAHYLAAQYLGAFVGAAVVYFVYYDALMAYEAQAGIAFQVPETAGVWTTFPQSYRSIGGSWLDQIVATAVLVGLVCAVVDPKNMSVRKDLVPLYVGFIVFSIGMSLGYNNGYAINPARDLGPRLFVFIAGWEEAFSYADYYFVIPVVACHIGGILGAVVYQMFIENHWPEEECLREESDDNKCSDDGSCCKESKA